MRVFVIITSFIASVLATGVFAYPASFEVEGGLTISNQTNELVWIGAGTINPMTAPGLSAPIGSQFRRTNGDVYQKIGPLDTDWQLDGLGSAVFTQAMSFGKNGNSSANSFLYRVGSVPSNVSGVITLLSNATLRSMGCGSQNISTYTIEVWQHDGDFINPTLLYSFPVVNARSLTLHNLDIPVTQNKQIGLKTLDAVQDVGCTLAIKGLGL